MTGARRLTTLLAVSLPPLALAVAGLLHPHELTAATAGTWTGLHVVLLPVWGLLGVALAVLVRREHGPLAVLVRVAALVFVTFYGALDAINGIALGELVRLGVGDPASLNPLVTLGNRLAWVGSVAFLVGVLAMVAVLVRRLGRPALVGALLSTAAAVSFLDSHIYWPRGVVTMLVLAVGFGLLGLRRPAGGAGEPVSGDGPVARR